MKSQAIRAFVLLALIAIAHQIKPFTTTNVIAFAGASLGSLTELLPESALRKASVLAAVVSRAWQTNDALALPAANVLAVNKATNAPAKRRAKITPALPVHVAAVSESEAEEAEFAHEPVISWQPDVAEETPAIEKMELPHSIEMPQAAAPAWSTITPTPKRDACELPTETKPMPNSMNEGETEPSMTPQRSGRPVRPAEIEPLEIQPVTFPRKSSRLPVLNAAQKNASKC